MYARAVVAGRERVFGRDERGVVELPLTLGIRNGRWVRLIYLSDTNSSENDILYFAHFSKPSMREGDETSK